MPVCRPIFKSLCFSLIRDIYIVGSGLPGACDAFLRENQNTRGER